MNVKKTALESVEETLACSAFAEKGETCPEENIEEGLSAAARTAAEEKESILEAVEETLACSAFAESSEQCPKENIEEGISATSHTSAEKK